MTALVSFVAIVINLVRVEMLARQEDFNQVRCPKGMSKLKTIQSFEDVNSPLACGVYCAEGNGCNDFGYNAFSKNCHIYAKSAQMVKIIPDAVTNHSRCWSRMSNGIKQKASIYESPNMTQYQVGSRSYLFQNIIVFLVGKDKYLVTLDFKRPAKLLRFTLTGDIKTISIEDIATDIERLTSKQVIAVRQFKMSLLIVDVYPEFKLNRIISMSIRFLHIEILSEEMMVLSNTEELHLFNFTSEQLSPLFSPRSSFFHLAASPKGNLLLKYAGNIVLHNLTGGVIWKYDEFFKSFTFDRLGNVLVVTDRDEVKLLSGDGVFLKTILDRNAGWKVGPGYLRFDEQDDVYISDRSTGIIYLVTFQ